MDPDQWDRVRAIYHAALDKDPGERASYLEEICRDDPALHREVSSLLAESSAGSFLERPAWQSTQPEERRPEPAHSATLSNGPAAVQLEHPPACRHPFLWVVWLVLTGLAVAFGYTGWRLPRDRTLFGWSEASRGGLRVVAAVNPTGPAAGKLRTGDVLLSLNDDEHVAQVGASIYRLYLKIGESYRLRVRRGESELQVALTVGHVSPNMPYLLFWYFQSLTWCAIGLFIGFARPQDGLARLAFAAATLTGFVYLQADHLPAWTALQPLHGILGYHFFYRFPGEPPRGRGWRILLWLLYLFGLPVGLHLAYSKAVCFLYGPQALTPWLVSPLARSARPLMFVVFAASMLGAAVVAIHKYRRVTDPDQRLRFHWVALGGFVGLAPEVPYSLFSFARSNLDAARWLFPGQSWTWFVNSMTGLSIAVPISVAYAVVRHHVFDVKVVIRRGLQYAFARRFLQVLLALPSGILLYTLVTQHDRSIADVVAGASGSLFWILGLGLSLRFRASLLRWLDKRFFRDSYDSGQVVLGLVEELGRLDSAEEVSGAVCRHLGNCLHPKTMRLWWRRNGAMTLVESTGPAPEGAAFPISESTFHELVRQGSVLRLTAPADSGPRGSERARLADTGVHLVVPISGAEGAEGVLMLGEKESEEQYSAGDEQLIRAVVRKTSVVLDNVRLKGKMREEQRIRVEVLSKLGPNLANLMKQCPDCGACFDGNIETCPRDGAAVTLTVPVARTIHGRYRLDQLLGRGGMGAVYQAHDLRLEREVAVKVMLGRGFGEAAALRRFRREGQAVARLNHPSIVAMFDCGELEGGGAYLVMERVCGVTLREEMRGKGVLPPSLVADWFDQLLDGLAAAHQLGVVHRDLKPENVLGTRRESGALLVKLLDFGLAKILPVASTSDSAQSLTESGVVVGTFAYMAPEQLARQEVGAEADIYAAGVMLVEALTGARPCLDGRGMNSDYHLPAALANDGPLTAVIQRCLALTPRDRFSSAADLRDALIPALRACRAPAPDSQ